MQQGDSRAGGLSLHGPTIDDQANPWTGQSISMGKRHRNATAARHKANTRTQCFDP
jgi:hypothetical protein